MKSDICKKCINYCNNSTELDLIHFSKENNIKIGECIDSSSNGDLLHFAPAGNFPKDPIVTICGLATSVQAKEYMKKEVNINSENMYQICLNSVYQGKMAINLALMMKALKIFRHEVKLKIDNEVISIEKLNINYFKKSKGMFYSLPDELHLTQATCCWNENGKSKYKKEWWGNSYDCRNNGYLKNILRRFLNSNKSKIFIFLGSDIKENIIIEESIKKNNNILLLSTKSFNSNEFSKPDKLIFNIHHPANTGFIYNNCRNSNLKSLLYSYYENNGWDFSPRKYADKEIETMNRNLEYYKYISGIIEKLL